MAQSMGANMRLYTLDVFEPPERLRHHRDFRAPDDEAAIKRAHEFFDALQTTVLLDRFVLYDGKRVIHEHTGLKR